MGLLLLALVASSIMATLTYQRRAGKRLLQDSVYNHVMGIRQDAASLDLMQTDTGLQVTLGIALQCGLWPLQKALC